MLIDPAALSREANYKLMTGTIVPRPIAWVTTLSPGGGVNLAPFSAFTFVSSSPPMVGISVGRKAGMRKDTANNIAATGAFVVHIPDTGLLEAVHASSAEFAADVSETEMLGLATLPSTRIPVPRLAAAPVAMECRLHSTTAYGELQAEFIVGEVIAVHVRDGLMIDGKIDTRTLAPICRLGGPSYALLGEIVQQRPVAVSPK